MKKLLLIAGVASVLGYNISNAATRITVVRIPSSENITIVDGMVYSNTPSLTTPQTLTEPKESTETLLAKENNKNQLLNRLIDGWGTDKHLWFSLVGTFFLIRSLVKTQTDRKIVLLGILGLVVAAGLLVSTPLFLLACALLVGMYSKFKNK